MLKKLGISFITLSATAPLAVHLTKGKGEEGINLSKVVSDSLGMNQYRSPWLRECKPFSNLMETIFVCPEIWEGLGPSFYYYKVESKRNDLNNSFSVRAHKVENLDYKHSEKTLIACLSNGNKVSIQEFPEEFKTLKTDWTMDPNKSCKMEGRGGHKSLSCQFIKNGEYIYISLVE